MPDFLSTVQALADHFDTKAATEAFGTLTKQQLTELQKTLAAQMEELKKADADPDKERKIANLKRLRALVRETLTSSLHNLLVSTLSDAVQSEYGELTPETLESVGVTPDLVGEILPQTKNTPKTRDSMSAFDRAPGIIRQVPQPIIGSEIPVRKNERKQSMTFAEFKQDIDPSNQMSNFMVGLRYIMYKPFEFFRNLFGGRAQSRKQVDAKVSYIAEDSPTAATKTTPTKPKQAPKKEPAPEKEAPKKKPAAEKDTPPPVLPAPPATEADRVPQTPASPGVQDVVDPFADMTSVIPTKRPAPTPAFLEEEEGAIPDRVTFEELKRGPIRISKYTVELDGPNGIVVNNRRWKLLHKDGVDIRFKNIIWENGKLTITGEAVNGFARLFGGSDDDNTMVMDKKAALETLEYLATSGDAWKLVNKKNKPLGVTLTPVGRSA